MAELGFRDQCDDFLSRWYHRPRRVHHERDPGAAARPGQDRRRVEEHQHHAELHPQYGGEDETSPCYTTAER